MRTLSVLLGLLVPLVAHAEVDPRRAISADAVATLSVRPIGIAGALHRLGPGWDALARKELPIPSAVSPFDPNLISALGIEPAATVWVGIRPLRGGAHLRVAVPLVSERIAAVLLESVARAAGIELTRGPASSWLGKTRSGVPFIARLDGEMLVADLFPRLEGVQAVELLRLAPLRPPRPFSTEHGAARRIGPADALSVWLDLPGIAALALTESEHVVKDALKNVDAQIRTKIERQGRQEIATCRTALRTATSSFDDASLSLAISGLDELKAQITLGGAHGRVELGRTDGNASVRASRGVAEALGEVDVMLSITEPILGRLLAPPAKTPVASTAIPAECPAFARMALGLRAWPAMLASQAAGSDARSKQSAIDLARFLSGVRALALGFPASDGDQTAPMMRQLTALVEADLAERGDLDRALLGRFGAAVPLKLAARQISAYALPAFPWSQGEGPIVAVDTLPSVPVAMLVGFGPRDTLRQTLDRVGPARPSTTNPDAFATLAITERGMTRGIREVFARNDAARSLVVGITKLDASLALDPALLRLDANISLRPAEPTTPSP